ncbi:hypothetical protein DdX_16696 [Ditylenchus destructor]|uniref:G-protein coupled receptors family 1 profile domain-containing protein n=1 Tax=Ditylenchus destructor TaxID=166010 RepID=A0AAD4MMP4_9BILA|nr:hypothetical protein DdX_16696 [Ditylenchus destructor]
MRALLIVCTLLANTITYGESEDCVACQLKSKKMQECLEKYQVEDEDSASVKCSKKQQSLENCVHYYITEYCDEVSARGHIKTLCNSTQYYLSCPATKVPTEDSFCIKNQETNQFLQQIHVNAQNPEAESQIDTLILACTNNSTPYNIKNEKTYINLANAGAYDPYMLVCLGMFVFVYYELSSVSAFILTLDRCLLLKFPLYYKLSIRKYSTQMSILALLLLSLRIIFWNILLEMPIDVFKFQNCQTISCVTSKVQNAVMGYTKLVFAGLNIILMFYFLWILRGTTMEKQKDRIVKVTIMIETAFNGLPALATHTFLVITGRSSANYIGQTSSWLVALNVAICSILFWNILVKRSDNITFVRRVTNMASRNVVPAANSISCEP